MDIGADTCPETRDGMQVHWLVTLRTNLVQLPLCAACWAMRTCLRIYNAFSEHCTATGSGIFTDTQDTRVQMLN